MSRFPAAFPPPAFASRSSDSRQGIGFPHGRPTGQDPAGPDGVTAFRTHELRPGWVPPIPRGRGAHPAGSPPQPAPAASQRQVPRPRQQPTIEGPLHEASTGVHAIHPSGLPLAHAPGMEPAALRLPPELRTLPSPATHVRGGDRPSSTDLELPLNSHPSISNPVVHSMRATSRRTANTEVSPTSDRKTWGIHVASGKGRRSALGPGTFARGLLFSGSRVLRSRRPRAQQHASGHMKSLGPH